MAIKHNVIEIIMIKYENIDFTTPLHTILIYKQILDCFDMKQ